jgi:hypothetical protein
MTAKQLWALEPGFQWCGKEREKREYAHFFALNASLFWTFALPSSFFWLCFFSTKAHPKCGRPLCHQWQTGTFVPANFADLKKICFMFAHCNKNERILWIYRTW